MTPAEKAYLVLGVLAWAALAVLFAIAVCRAILEADLREQPGPDAEPAAAPFVDARFDDDVLSRIEAFANGDDVEPRREWWL